MKLVVGILIATLSLVGCQTREKVEIPVETTQPQTMSPIESSAVEVTMKKEPAIVMETRNEVVYVTGSQVNVRNEADTSGDIVTSLKQGTSLQRIGYDEVWSQIVYEDQVYYMVSEFLSTEEPVVEVTETTEATEAAVTAGEIGLNSSWKYAEFSKINTGKATLYRSEATNANGIVVCVNAGHGTSGGSSVKTQCHPDGTPKVTGGTTAEGATTAVAVSTGMEFLDGTSEASVTLSMALVLKEKLLAAGYDVLMIRETADVQLDNIARTVIANNMADCHIALHWDSTTSDKGVFYMSVPDVASYRAMEPVASTWQQHHALGDSLLVGLQSVGAKLFSDGKMAMDLTQTSYSTIPSIDIELGDKASDYSSGTLNNLANGLVTGVNQFFQQ